MFIAPKYQFNVNRQTPALIVIFIAFVFTECILLHPQFLTSTLEAAYNSCNCSEIIYTEYRRRVNSRGSNVEKRRLRPIWGLFTRPKGFDSATYSAVEISKYNIASKRHEDIGEITLGKRTLFGVILHNEKIYILGGHRSGHWLNSVSDRKIP